MTNMFKNRSLSFRMMNSLSPSRHINADNCLWGVCLGHTHPRLRSPSGVWLVLLITEWGVNSHFPRAGPSDVWTEGMDLVLHSQNIAKLCAYVTQIQWRSCCAFHASTDGSGDWIQQSSHLSTAASLPSPHLHFTGPRTSSQLLFLLFFFFFARKFRLPLANKTTLSVLDPLKKTIMTWKESGATSSFWRKCYTRFLM